MKLWLVVCLSTTICLWWWWWWWWSYVAPFQRRFTS